MKNILKFSFITLFFSGQLYSQQTLTIDDYRDDLQYSSKLFFNNMSVNPAYAGDSLRLRLGTIYSSLLEGVGTYKDFNFIADGYIEKINSGVGINYDYQDNMTLKYLRISTFYNYGINLSSYFKLRFGCEIGINGTKIELTNVRSEDPTNPSYSSWSYKPIFNLGSYLKYKNQQFGISFKDEQEKAVNSYSTTYSNRNKLNLNYKINLKISDVIMLNPEIIDIYNFNSNAIVLLSKVSYKDKLGIGLLFNSTGYKSFMLSGTFFKMFELGYNIDYYSKLDGSFYNGLFLKLLIK